MGRRVSAAEAQAAFKAAEEYEDQKKAETEKLLAAHYYRRRKSVARGFVVEHRKMPRGWHHALAARHPVTRRSFLPARAIILLNALYNEAEKVLASTGALRVFGKTQGFYAKLLGLSMRRGRNGEANGARRVREYLRQLAQLNIIAKGGRCWFDGPGKHPRLVLWIRPFEEWTLARFAEAVNELPPSENDAAPAPVSEESDRISRSGCFTDHIEINSEVCGGMGGTGGKEAPSAPSIITSPSLPPVDNAHSTASSPSVSKERPSAATQEPPSAAANEGGRANSGPTAGAKLDAAKAVMLLGASALRIFRGPELAELIQHVARTHPRPVDAADGRPPRLPSPAAAHAPGAAPARPGARPHPSPCGCGACQAWARAIVAAPAPESPEALPTIRPPAVRVQRSPWAESPRPAAPEQLGDLLAGIAHREQRDGEALDDDAQREQLLQQALARSIRWERTRCYAKEGKRCKPGDRQPCQKCVDVDFPFRAVVDGRPWKLRYDGRHSPFTLTIDGRELGPVALSWPITWRSVGAPTAPAQIEDEDGDGD
jgi:hypothetical protein